MAKFRRISTGVVDAVQWFKNGDHPEDACCGMDERGNPFQEEGHVVRYFRRPDVPGIQICPHCEHDMHVHGWIDASDRTVCPGDWVIRDELGEYFPMKPFAFVAIYEPEL